MTYSRKHFRSLGKMFINSFHHSIKFISGFLISKAPLGLKSSIISPFPNLSAAFDKFNQWSCLIF